MTIPVLANAIHVNLPKTVQTTPPEQQKAITVTVDDAGRIFLDNREVPQQQFGGEPRALKATDSSLSLHLRADERVPYGVVAKVMAAIEHAGVSRVSVLTDQQE